VARRSGERVRDTPSTRATPAAAPLDSWLLRHQRPAQPFASGGEPAATNAESLANPARLPVYRTLFEREGEDRSHGRDERVGVQAFYDAAEFWYDLVMALAGG
jgi:acetylornithine deacetylase/succinyl-diaminopimelate desuccinylase-like protein